MAEVLDSGHVITDEDVDTARLIMELDRALGRPTDPLTKRVAATTSVSAPLVTNGHQLPAADALAKALTSEENAAELAREVTEQLPENPDPAEQARVAARVQAVIRRGLTELLAKVDPGH